MAQNLVNVKGWHILGHITGNLQQQESRENMGNRRQVDLRDRCPHIHSLPESGEQPQETIGE